MVRHQRNRLYDGRTKDEHLLAREFPRADRNAPVRRHMARAQAGPEPDPEAALAELGDIQFF